MYYAAAVVRLAPARFEATPIRALTRATIPILLKSLPSRVVFVQPFRESQSCIASRIFTVGSVDLNVLPLLTPSIVLAAFGTVGGALFGFDVRYAFLT